MDFVDLFVLIFMFVYCDVCHVNVMYVFHVSVVYFHMCMYICTCESVSLNLYIWQSNLTIGNRLRTTEKLHYTGGSLHQGVHYIRVFTISGCSLHQGVHYIRVFTTSGCSLHQGVHYIRVFATSGCSLYQGVHYIILRSMFAIQRVCCIQGSL